METFKKFLVWFDGAKNYIPALVFGIVGIAYMSFLIYIEPWALISIPVAFLVIGILLVVIAWEDIINWANGGPVYPAEEILCAANWYPELEFPHTIEDLTPIYWLPQNIDRGIVFSGRHHLQCMYQAQQLVGKRQCEMLEYQGFLTSHNRWVTRDEAGQIAYEAGQIEKAKHLFSEDFDYPYPKHEKRGLPKERN